MIKVLGVLLISVMASSSMTFFLVSFFTNNNAFGTACTVIGTMIGFLTGVYLPIGTLPSAMQWVIKLFPVSHSAALLRQVFLEAPIQQSFPGAPALSLIHICFEPLLDEIVKTLDKLPKTYEFEEEEICLLYTSMEPSGRASV